MKIPLAKAQWRKSAPMRSINVAAIGALLPMPCAL